MKKLGGSVKDSEVMPVGDINYTPENKKKLRLGRIKSEISDLQEQLRSTRSVSSEYKDLENQIRELKGALRETQA